MTQQESIPNLSNCSAQFQKDFTQLEKDIGVGGSTGYEAAQKLEKKERECAFNDRKLIFEKYSKNPGLLLMMMTTVYFGQGVNNLYSSKLNADASGIKIQTDLTKLTNDLQNIINSGSKNPDAVKEVAAGADVMETILKPGAKKGTLAGELQAAVGGPSDKTAEFMFQNFAKIRGEINWSADPQAALFNHTSKQFYLTVGSGAGINTFHKMEKELSKQGNTSAQEANKGFIDAYNQNVAVTQSMGTTANTAIGLLTSKIKLNTTTVSDLAQDFLTLDRTAINNEVSRG